MTRVTRLSGGWMAGAEEGGTGVRDGFVREGRGLEGARYAWRTIYVYLLDHYF